MPGVAEVLVLAAVLAANLALAAWAMRWSRHRLAAEVARRGGRLVGMRYVWHMRRTWEVSYVDAAGTLRAERMTPTGSYVWQRTGPGAVPASEAFGQTTANPAFWRTPVPLRPLDGRSPRASPRAILGWAFAALWAILGVLVVPPFLGAGPLVLGAVLAFGAVAAVAAAAFVRMRPAAGVRSAPAPPSAAGTLPQLPSADARRRGRLAGKAMLGYVAGFAVLVALFLASLAPAVPPWMWFPFLAVPVAALLVGVVQMGASPDPRADPATQARQLARSRAYAERSGAQVLGGALVVAGVLLAVSPLLGSAAHVPGGAWGALLGGLALAGIGGALAGLRRRA